MPPDRRFKWSLRNNTNYMQTGCLSILDYTAKHSKEMLRNFYRKHYNSWQKGVKGEPFAYVIAAEQGDRRRVAEMLNVLMGHRIEVGRARAPFKVTEGEFPAGTYVVRLDQPYRNYAVDLLEPQKFPADTPYQPYDDVSWALPVHYGVEAKRVADAKIKDVPLEPVGAELRPAGRVAGDGPFFLLKDTGQESLLAARQRLSGYRIEIAERAFKVGAAEYAAGSWVIPAQKDLRAALERVSAELGLDFEAAPTAPEVARHESRLPRLAVWHTWDDTQAVGWIRYTLDQQKIAYDYISDEDVRAGNLRRRYDVILYGHTYSACRGRSTASTRSTGRCPSRRRPEFPSHGVPDASEDITGGIGWGGMAHLEKFLAEGGTLITLGGGSQLALDGGLVREVSRGPGGRVHARRRGARKVLPSRPPARLRLPGESSRPSARTSPSTTSAPQTATSSSSSGAQNRRARSARRPPAGADKDKPKEKERDAGPMLVSGGMRGEDTLEGRPAILDLPAGRGRVLAYNFNPMHRDLNHSDYRLLWNALLNWSALPPARR